MRASRADREQAIDVLKIAFVQERLTKGELDARVGRALAARTYADLDALTADIPAGPDPARSPVPAAAAAARGPAALARNRPAKRAVTSGLAGVSAVGLGISIAAGVASGSPVLAVALLVFAVILAAVAAGAAASIWAVVVWLEAHLHKRPGGTPPPRSAPRAGGQAHRRTPSPGRRQHKRGRDPALAAGLGHHAQAPPLPRGSEWPPAVTRESATRRWPNLPEERSMMCPRRPARCWAVVLAALAVPGVLAGCAPGSAPAASEGAPQAAVASCAVTARGQWTAAEPGSPGSNNNDLTGVAVLAAGNAWAVGTYADSSGGRTLAEHWNGSAWSVVPSPDPDDSGDFLSAVSAVSPSVVWAVGEYESGGRSKTLIVRWNGTSWEQVASPNPGSDNFLNGVWAVSAKDVWAVGRYGDGPSGGSSLILHWNGSRWAQVPSPDPGFRNELDAVTATSAASAWAVGSSSSQQAARPFILHWNGTVWTQVDTPHLKGTGGELLGVDATSAVNVWAAGDVSDRAGQHTLILRWNGTAWTRVPSPDPGGSRFVDSLRGVAAISAANAWAVGYISNGASNQSLILHWNGAAWTRAASPSPGAGGDLAGIAASSPASTWAVGQFGAVGGDDAFAVRYCARASE